MSPVKHFANINILSVFDMLPIGIAMLNKDGVMLYCNKKLGKLIDYSPEQAIGLPCRHVLKTRLCVSGCKLGCMAFAYASKDTAPVHSTIRVEELAETIASLRGGQETNLISWANKSIPVRLTHLPVAGQDNKLVFYLDIIEDLRELKTAEMRFQQNTGDGTFIGKSIAMSTIISTIPSIATSNTPVLLTGETGTGKDLLAETIHRSSYRAREPFVKARVNYLPENVLHQELFGSMQNTEHEGYFQQANNGTLYITELADIPKSIQVQLINFLDHGTIIPDGTKNQLPLNVRLITATNQNPDELVKRQILLPELYYRLNLGHIHLPPLRERAEDMDFLLQHFLQFFTNKLKKSIGGFSEEVRNMLTGHSFPGNVRELKNIVEYAVMVSFDEQIQKSSLPSYLALAAPKANFKKRKGNAKT